MNDRTKYATKVSNYKSAGALVEKSFARARARARGQLLADSRPKFSMPRGMMMTRAKEREREGRCGSEANDKPPARFALPSASHFLPARASRLS